MKKQHSIGNRVYVYIFIAFLIFYGIFVAIRAIRNSAFLDQRDRVNIVFYGEEPKLLSFGLTDDVNYIVSFTNEDRADIPGGYGRYAVGSFGRLAEVERNKAIIRHAFASMTSTYIDYYVAPKKSLGVFVNSDAAEPTYQRGGLIRSLFSANTYTNANFFDKIYLSWLIAKKRQSSFIPLKSTVVPGKNGAKPSFSEKGFQKKYKGFFYHQGLREESGEVQIRYQNYASALVLSRIIEGQGIRVVDLSLGETLIHQRCIVRHNLSSKSKTVYFLLKRFSCLEQKGDAGGSDILFILGPELEKEWEWYENTTNFGNNFGDRFYSGLKVDEGFWFLPGNWEIAPSA